MNGSGKLSTFLNGAGFYIVLFLAIAVIGASGYFIYDTIRGDAPRQDAIAAQSGADSAPEHSVVPIISSENHAEDDAPVRQTIAVSGTTQVAEDAPAAKAQTDTRIVPPLEGETTVPFSMEQLLYNATLDDWRTHDGIDIAAEEGTAVVSAAEGKVSAIVNDYWMGVTVTVLSSDGYELVYAGLQSGPAVSVGDYLSPGDTIGRVGTTALLEEGQGAHLHFSVKKNGAAVDPADYLGRAE